MGWVPPSRRPPVPPVGAPRGAAFGECTEPAAAMCRGGRLCTASAWRPPSESPAGAVLAKGLAGRWAAGDGAQAGSQPAATSRPLPSSPVPGSSSRRSPWVQGLVCVTPPVAPASVAFAPAPPAGDGDRGGAGVSVQPRGSWLSKSFGFCLLSRCGGDVTSRGGGRCWGCPRAPRPPGCCGVLVAQDLGHQGHTGMCPTRSGCRALLGGCQPQTWCHGTPQGGSRRGPNCSGVSPLRDMQHGWGIPLIPFVPVTGLPALSPGDARGGLGGRGSCPLPKSFPAGV